MSMGYDDDDPRREYYAKRFAEGAYKLAPGQRANVDASKQRAGAMPGKSRRDC